MLFNKKPLMFEQKLADTTPLHYLSKIKTPTTEMRSPPHSLQIKWHAPYLIYLSPGIPATYSRHCLAKNSSHVSCSACWFSLKTVNLNPWVHRLEPQQSSHLIDGTIGWDFLVFNKHQWLVLGILANRLSPKALQGYVTTCPDHDIDRIM